MAANSKIEWCDHTRKRARPPMDEPGVGARHPPRLPAIRRGLLLQTDGRQKADPDRVPPRPPVPYGDFQMMDTLAMLVVLAILMGLAFGLLP